MPRGTRSPEVTFYLALLGCLGTCGEVARECSLSPEPAASGYSVSQKMERYPCVLLRMVGNPCLGKTEGWNSRGGKGQARHGMENVQSSPSRGWEERWCAGRAQGYGKSKGCLSLVLNLSSNGRAGTAGLWERCRRHGGHQQRGQGWTSKA